MRPVELDERLRELFADERLDLPVRPEAASRIVVGARRRRQARTAVAGTLAVAVVAGGFLAAQGLRVDSAAEPGAPPAVTIAPRDLERPAYGKFRLGMTEAEALAAGGLEPAGAEGSCTRYRGVRPGGEVVVSAGEGVVRFPLTSRGVTPSGVGFGSTVEDVRRAYPAAAVEGDRVVVVMGSGWRYVFTLEDDRVGATVIEKVESECWTG